MFVSVVMPVYNGQAFLREAIESVLAQTHLDLELVAIDDGSADESPAILADLAVADPRVRVIRQANGGGARARNRALQEARAEWIINLDQDDLMLPNRIERQLAFLAAHPDVKVFSCRALYINAAGKAFGKTKCEPITTRAAFERHLASGEPIGINPAELGEGRVDHRLHAGTPRRAPRADPGRVSGRAARPVLVAPAATGAADARARPLPRRGLRHR
jgi:glycosyltransferase involved in cell wall biosynthesis